MLTTVDAFLLNMRSIAEALAGDGAFAGLDEVIVSAGGSSYFDRVATLLSSLDLRRPCVRSLEGAPTLHTTLG